MPMPAKVPVETSTADSQRDRLEPRLRYVDGTEPAPPQRFLCLNLVASAQGYVTTNVLAGCTERHAVTLPEVAWEGLVDPSRTLGSLDDDVAGLVLVTVYGWLGRTEMRVARQALSQGLDVYVHWPSEKAVEVLDDIRLESFRNLWAFVHARRVIRGVGNRLAARVPGRLRRLFTTPATPVAVENTDPNTSPVHAGAKAIECIRDLQRIAQPVPFTATSTVPAADSPIPANGVYLRTDYWARIQSGGSYGHTCYVAKSLSKVTDQLVCFMAHRFPMLDDFGTRVRQIPMDVPFQTNNEIDIVRAPEVYYQRLKLALETLKPAYLYERLCLGNYTAARLSIELGIPYFVEYNGSEITMKKSFDDDGYELEEAYLAAESLAFRQATAISVVSEPIRDDLIAAGVDADKIIVLPNAADPDDYFPPTPETKRDLRTEFGWSEEHCVVGFTGTFGGWHGIDVLAEALPLIAKNAPNVRFLLIGDGNFKHLVDDAIIEHGLENVVHCTGRVPQEEGRRLLGACDVFVSPHNRHMVDGRFFGSPTKLFEYMSVGGCIVASDLEQIGQVLTPALQPGEVGDDVELGNRRAVLCTPGSVEEVVTAVTELATRPTLREELGANARKAIIDHYSWDQHVRKLMQFVVDGVREEPCPAPATEAAAESPLQRIETGDDLKDQVQNQWNENPCGSHYVKGFEPHTLEWYLEAERYRYEEYAPWMRKTMEFDGHAGETLLEIGAGMGTDHAQFALGGAIVTDVDLSAGHLAHAQENFRLRGLEGTFVHNDAETLPFDDDTFDVVYSNGVIHHTPNTAQVIEEIHRVLKPGGKAIIMVYAEQSLHYWSKLVGAQGLADRELWQRSVGEIMSRSVEITENDAKPLVKVYTAKRLRRMFGEFQNVSICKRQLMRAELPRLLKWMPLGLAGRMFGWNLIVKATK